MKQTLGSIPVVLLFFAAVLCCLNSCGSRPGSSDKDTGHGDSGSDTDADTDTDTDTCGDAGIDGWRLSWAARQGEGFIDYMLGLDVLKDGSALVTGHLDLSFGGPAGGTFVAKYDAWGEQVWLKSEPNIRDNDRGWDIAALDDGSSFVTGFFDEQATFGQGEPGQTTLTADEESRDIYVARFKPDGDLSWAQGAGGPENGEEGYRVAVLSDGSAVVVGSFKGDAVFGKDTPFETAVTSVGEMDAFIARYSPQGDLLWVKSAGGAETDFATGIAVLDGESFVVSGIFHHAALFGAGEVNETLLTGPGNRNAFVAKYSLDGELEWVSDLGIDSGDSSSGRVWWASLTGLGNGGAAVTGKFLGTMTRGAEQPGLPVIASSGENADIYVARFDSSGQKLWSASAGAADYEDRGVGIAAFSNGKIAVGGGYCGDAVFGAGEVNETVLSTGCVQGWHPFLALYNPDGSLGWVLGWGNTASAGALGDIAVSNDDATLWAAGWFLGSVEFGTGLCDQVSLTSSSEHEDGLLLRFDKGDLPEKPEGMD